MYIKNLNIGEGAYLEDKLDLDAHGRTERRCLIIKQTVDDGTFSLAEALENYNVPLETYIEFKVRNVIHEMRSGLGRAVVQEQMAVLAQETSSAVHKYFRHSYSKHIYKGSWINGSGTISESSGVMVDTKFKLLFLNGLSDMLWAENRVAKELPKFGEAVHNRQISFILDTHSHQKATHVGILEKIFRLFDRKPSRKRSITVANFLIEAKGYINENEPGTAVREAGVVMATQKILHYNIATYDSLIKFAELMGNSEAAELLGETLENERETNIALSNLGEYWSIDNDNLELGTHIGI